MFKFIFGAGLGVLVMSGVASYVSIKHIHLVTSALLQCRADRQTLMHEIQAFGEILPPATILKKGKNCSNCNHNARIKGE